MKESHKRRASTEVGYKQRWPCVFEVSQSNFWELLSAMHWDFSISR